MTKPTRTAPDESLTAPSQDKSRALDFIRDDAPDVGSATEIADGIYWLRFPLPMKALDHINLWAIKDGDGWAVVDTGFSLPDSKEIWRDHFKTLMGGAPVTRVICTHLHPDHVGLAGWLTRKFDCPLIMTRGEYLLCRILVADTGQPAPDAGIRYYKRAGFNGEQIERYKKRFGGFGKIMTRMPNSYQRIEDGHVISIGGRDWHVVVGSGHSPEHACLYCPELKLCLTGDQILPNISSNVSVWPTEPEGNPLKNWIDSCHKLKDDLPEDTLICPAHGIPFYGAHKRLDKLIEHHENALVRLLKTCESPKLATGVYSALFRREINDDNRIMAVGESIAHLNCLLGRGLVSRELNAGGQWVYTAI